LLLHGGAVGGQEVADLVQEPVERRLVGSQDLVLLSSSTSRLPGTSECSFSASLNRQT
jgi:hypothetical protein